MKKLMMGVVAVLILFGVSFAAQKDSSFSGEISDRELAREQFSRNDDEKTWAHRQRRAVFRIA